MKKLVFGCALMLLGAICGTGWILAWCVIVGPNTPIDWTFPVATILNVLWGRLDFFIALLFYAISVCGACIALNALKRE